MSEEKYQNKYRIKSARHPYWDYSSAGTYFVTICTKNKAHYFGDIVNGTMKSTLIGMVAINEWLKSPEIRPNMNIILDEFCLMPNHFHGIIILYDDTTRCCRDTTHCVFYVEKQTKPLKSFNFPPFSLLNACFRQDGVLSRPERSGVHIALTGSCLNLSLLLERKISPLLIYNKPL